MFKIHKKGKKKTLLIMVLVFLVFGQSFAQYAIKKYSINSGGGKLSGGAYEVQGSIGQVDVSNRLTGGTYVFNGGFWHENNDLIFKNDFE